MIRRLLVIFLLVSCFSFAQKKSAEKAVPPPESVFGFDAGADFHLADYEQITKYFQALAASSSRIKLEQIGKSGYGKDMFVAVISSEENIRNLDRYKNIVK